ncbi:MAG: hypothetical protein HOP10_00685 [Chitinophagaceae bacterium]|nr:hypothetical protein [Chitinophagaceae bacterium]
MKVLFKLILFTGCITFMSACSKGGGSGNDDGGVVHIPSPNDITAPVLDIFSPTPDQVFTSGSNINVTGRITDDLGLYRGSIRITNDANGNILKEQLYEIHYVLNYNFNINYTPAVTVPSNYTVTVTFEDHGYNSATKTVKIKVNP